MIWLYVLLWLVEGSLRKWLLPQYSTPLLLVRDPVAAVILFYAFVQRIWRLGGWTVILWLLGFLSSLAYLSLEQPVVILLVGLRTLCLHLPLIFVFALVLQREDIARFGNIFTDLALPMSLLMVAQYLAPADALINAGATFGRGEQIHGAGDHIRAPGIFSYSTGVAQYFWLVAAFVCDRLLNPREWSVFTIIPAAVGCVFAVSVSISRTLIAGIAIVVAVFATCYLRSGITLRRTVYVLAVGAAIAVTGISSIVSDGWSSFEERWLIASDAEFSFFERAFSAFIIPYDTIVSAGVTGKGLGLGTNMASYLMIGEKEFFLAEHDWERIILEMGYLLGFAFIGWRVALVTRFGIGVGGAWLRGDFLPAMLFSTAGLALLYGQSFQPSILGYIVIASGLTAAALHSRESANSEEEVAILGQSREAEVEETPSVDREGVAAGGQKAEVGGQMSEVRGPKSVVSGPVVP